MTKYRACLIVILAFSLMTLGALTGYFILTPDPVQNTEVKTEAAKPELKTVSAPSGESINSGTKIIYEYVYLGGHKEENITFAPKNWYGLTLSGFRDIFTGWQIKEFSSEEVVLSKNLKAYSPNHYVLGVHDGYVAVFKKNDYNAENSSAVKQLTETPVTSLPEQEQKRLMAGIDFYGDKELAKILEDYET